MSLLAEIEQAASYCENRRVDLLATLVPKVVDPNSKVYLYVLF